MSKDVDFMGFLSNKSQLLIANKDYEIFDINTMNQVHITYHTMDVTSVIVSETHNRLYASSSMSPTSHFFYEFLIDPLSYYSRHFVPSNSPLLMKISPDETYIVEIHEHNLIIFYDTVTFPTVLKSISLSSLANNSLNAIQFSENSQEIFIGIKGGTIMRIEK